MFSTQKVNTLFERVSGKKTFRNSFLKAIQRDLTVHHPIGILMMEDFVAPERAWIEHK